MFKPYTFLLPLIFGFALFAVPSNGKAQPTVTLTVNDGMAAEAGQDTGQITITRSDDGNTASSLRVYLEVGGSAVRNADYTITNLFLSGGTTFYMTIPANELSRSVVLTPYLDNLIEGVEDVTFALLGPQLAGQDYTIGSPAEGAITISDDVAEVTLTLDDGEAAEAGQATAGFTVRRDNGGRTGVSLRVYLELGGSATRNTDYTVSNLFLSGGTTFYMTIPANELSRSVVLTPYLDNLIEGVEDVTFALLDAQLAGQDYTVGSPAGGEITISDDVAEVTLTLDDGEAAEAGQATAGFTVRRDNGGRTGVSLRVYVELGGSATRNTDYTVSNLFLSGGTTFYMTIPANELSRSVVLTPYLDNLIEGDEDVTFALLDAQLAGQDYTVGSPAGGEITISDDVAEVTLTLDDGEAAEAGQATAGFTVRRDNGGRTGVSLRVYVELGGSATRNTDYTVSNLFLSGGTTFYMTIPANELSRSVVLTPYLDNLIEGDENVTFTLLGPQLTGQDYTVGSPSQAEIIILDFVDIIFRDGFEQDQ